MYSGEHSKIGSFNVLWAPENSDKLVALTKKKGTHIRIIWLPLSMLLVIPFVIIVKDFFFFS